MKILSLLFTVLLFILFAFPAYAEDEYQDVTVFVDEILVLDYTGDYDLEFHLTQGDIDTGQLTLPDQGDLQWTANTMPWKITISRTGWEPEVDFSLQVKHDDSGYGGTSWGTIYTYETDWFTGYNTGNGVIGGVDWMVDNLGAFPEPGFYNCTVTITIVSDP